ncbi:hypothetical protein DFJ73DRAFT_768909 [Zopfochytrium polystomum]|nr:hypothetical protein DFJ73DRAFT_768909 [Zopfochytrium polystomum]
MRFTLLALLALLAGAAAAVEPTAETGAPRLYRRTRSKGFAGPDSVTHITIGSARPVVSAKAGGINVANSMKPVMMPLNAAGVGGGGRGTTLATTRTTTARSSRKK